jgi:hypothetical protein
MLSLESINEVSHNQPYFFYQRVNLILPITYLFFTIDYGFWYLLRQIHVKYPSDDGAIGFNNLEVFAIQKASSKEPQNIPIPFTLFGTPGNSGIQLFPGNQMTAGRPQSAKLQNVVYPFRDTMEFQISGQNIAGPPILDICLIGYYVPVKNFSMWNQ